MSDLDVMIDGFAREPKLYRERLADAIRAEIDERIKAALSEFVEGMKECKNPWHEWMTAKHAKPCPDCGETD